MKQIRAGLAVLGVAVFLLGIAAAAFSSPPLHAYTTPHSTAEYVGAETCYTCHYDAYPSWDTRLRPMPTLDVAQAILIDVAVQSTTSK